MVQIVPAIPIVQVVSAPPKDILNGLNPSTVLRTDSAKRLNVFERLV
jgi:hypothetical protein